MTVVRWERPPREPRVLVPRVDARWTAVAEALRLQPRQWAVIAVGVDAAQELLSRLRRGQPPWVAPGDWESTRAVVDGVPHVYARWYPPPPPVYRVVDALADVPLPESLRALHLAERELMARGQR